jgi:hypothetical protein
MVESFREQLSARKFDSKSASEPNPMKKLIRSITILVVALFGVAVSQAQTSVFTYQGRLNDGAAAGTGTYQMQFALFSAASGGTQIGSTLTFDGTGQPAVQVANGIFTVQLDFSSSPFTSGADRFLEISVKHAADPGYTTLAPRQQLTSSPFSIRTLAAGTADALSSNCLGCVTDAQISGVDGSKVTGTVANATDATNATNATNAVNATTANSANTANTANSATNATNANNASNLNNQPASSYVLTSDSRLTDSRAPTAGSSFYIQNQTGSTQTGGFSLSGTGGANIFNAATEFDLGGSRVLSADGGSNLLVGPGTANTTGTENSFFGVNAGSKNTSAPNNSFFGAGAGFNNTTSGNNSFFGAEAGFNNTGLRNSFFGTAAGFANTSGHDNATLGNAAGETNTTGTNNTILGANADVNANNLIFASAIGGNAKVNANDTIVLGKVAGTYNSVSRPADAVLIPGNLTVSGTLTAPVSNMRVEATTAQTFATDAGSFLQVHFNSVLFSSGATFDDANDQIVIQQAGLYELSAGINFLVNGNGFRGLEILAGGHEAVSSITPATSASDTVLTAAALARLNVGDVVQVYADQNSGGNLNTDVFDRGGAFLSVVRVAP